MQQVPVQAGQLLPGAHLFEVVRGDHQEVAERVEGVEQLQDQGNLEDKKDTKRSV